MSEKVYPPGYQPGTASDPPPSYAGSAPPAAYPQTASYPRQAGVAPAPAPTTATGELAAPGGVENDVRYNESSVKRLRIVPVYPMCLAVFFYIWNCFIPGFGMWLGCVFLCGSHTVVKGDGWLKIICLQFWFGFLAILTLWAGIGYWIAIAWSVATISNNRLYYNKPIEEHEIRKPQPGNFGSVF
eukprot:scpid84093/ scgid14166/ 